MILRLIIYSIIFYILYKLFRKFKALDLNRASFKNQTKKEQPRPYDSNNVEEIDYDEIKWVTFSELKTSFPLKNYTIHLEMVFFFKLLSIIHFEYYSFSYNKMDNSYK